MPYLVCHHPYGGDWLRRLRRGCSGGALPPYPVAPPPLGQCPPGPGIEEAERKEAPVRPVFTALVRAVHHLVTATSEAVPPPLFTQERGKLSWSPPRAPPH